MSKTNFIGIDLGTTFSAIAMINEHGVPEIIENTEGERITGICQWKLDTLLNSLDSKCRVDICFG